MRVSDWVSDMSTYSAFRDNEGVCADIAPHALRTEGESWEGFFLRRKPREVLAALESVLDTGPEDRPVAIATALLDNIGSRPDLNIPELRTLMDTFLTGGTYDAGVRGMLMDMPAENFANKPASLNYLLSMGMHMLETPELKERLLGLSDTQFRDKAGALNNLLSNGMSLLRTPELEETLVGLPVAHFRDKRQAMGNLLSYGITDLQSTELQRRLVELPPTDFTNKAGALNTLLSNGITDLRSAELQKRIINLPPTDFADKPGALCTLLSKKVQDLNTGEVVHTLVKLPPSHFGHEPGKVKALDAFFSSTTFDNKTARLIVTELPSNHFSDVVDNHVTHELTREEATAACTRGGTPEKNAPCKQTFWVGFFGNNPGSVLPILNKAATGNATTGEMKPIRQLLSAALELSKVGFADMFTGLGTSRVDDVLGISKGNLGSIDSLITHVLEVELRNLPDSHFHKKQSEMAGIILRFFSEPEMCS